jgi:hypothetical protein
MDDVSKKTHLYAQGGGCKHLEVLSEFVFLADGIHLMQDTNTSSFQSFHVC